MQNPLAQALPVFRVVANGLEKGDGKIRFKVTLLATPRANAGSGTIPLSNWPSGIAAFFADRRHRLELAVHPIDRTGRSRPKCGTVADSKCRVTVDLRPLAAVAAKPRSADAHWRRIDEVWQRGFERALVLARRRDTSGTEAFGILMRELEKSTVGDSFAECIDGDVPLARPEALDSQGAIIGEGSGQGSSETIKSVLPIGHARFAEALRTERARRVRRKLEEGDGGSLERGLGAQDFSRDHRQQVPPDTKAGGGTAGDEYPLRKFRLEQLQSAAQGTSATRGRIAAEYRKIVDRMRDTACIPPSNDGSERRDEGNGARSSGPLRESVTSDDVAVHRYGTWPQSASPDAARSADATCRERISEQDAAEAIGQFFYAVQTSPSLSRLFGLAFDGDFEVPEEAVADILGPALRGDHHAFLQPVEELCEASCGGSAVRYSTGHGTFLPATRAELMLSSACSSEEVEAFLDGSDQRDGFVPLSGLLAESGINPATTRFELTTLDVRRAIDQAAEAARNGSTAARAEEDGDGVESKDLGQRHATTGFSFNDRRRAYGALEEIAALGEHNAGTTSEGFGAAGTRPLYAEDLTIGYTIDVQLTDSATRDWRNLMERKVGYGEIEKIDMIVPELIGHEGSERRLDLERAHISPTSRVMPQPVGPSDGRDIIVEECVATWDGSPMGVDVGADESRISQTGECVPKADVQPEPAFVRHLDLPREGGRRPPPLRYGRAYRFGMRCVYAGGGGLTLRDAERLYDAQKTGSLTLPRVRAGTSCGSEDGHVFRRNESILSPDILMRVEDAGREHGHMGFENSLEVCLRRSVGRQSSVSDGSEIPFPDSTPQLYPTLRDRERPIASERIIMPPTIGMKDAERHGLFDEGERGWRNWKDGAMPLLSYQGGYPKCPDVEEPGWNDERVMIRRGPPSFGSGRGPAVFSLRKKAELTADERYFPDPAARFLVIRLQQMGRNGYLNLPGQSLVVPFYQEGRSDMPLRAGDYNSVVPVRLLFRMNSGLARSRLTDERLVTIDDGGHSVSARRVTLELAPNEDLAVCLWCAPDEATLDRIFSLPHWLAEEGLESAAKTIVERLRTGGPIEELAAVQVIRATHAVNRPDREPYFAEISKTARPVQPVVPDAAPTFSIAGKLRIPSDAADSFEFYLTCAAPHSDKFDDPSLQRSLQKIRAGLWPTTPISFDAAESKIATMHRQSALGVRTQRPSERYLTSKEIFGFEAANDGRVTLQQQTVLLLRCDGVREGPAVSESDGWLELDLDRIFELAACSTAMKAGGSGSKEAPPSCVMPDQTPEEPRYGKVELCHTLPGRVARRLSLRPVAIGRHAEQFATRATFNLEGGSRRQRRVTPLTARDQSMVGPLVSDIWLDASIRPSPPALMHCEPSFIETSRAEGNGGWFRRRTAVRIRMKRPWFSSGEGELLGIVLAHPGAGGATLEDPIYAGAVSQWGGDPIWPGTPGEDRLVGIKQFDLDRCLHENRTIDYDLAVAPATVGGVSGGSPAVLSIPLDIDGSATERSRRADGGNNTAQMSGEDRATTIKVQLLLLEPHFDAASQSWYVILPLSLGRSVAAGLGLKLVRYQEHMVAHLPKASEVVDAPAVAMPERYATYRCVPKDADVTIEIEVEGQAHRGPYVHPDLQAAKAAVPVMRGFLFHETKDAYGALRRRAVLRPDESEEARSFARGVPVHRMDDGLTEWRACLTVPRTRMEELGEGRYVLYVTEHDRFMPATYPDEPVNWKEMGMKETLVESGARFAFRAELELSARN